MAQLDPQGCWGEKVSGKNSVQVYYSPLPYLYNNTYSDNTIKSMMATFIRRTLSRLHWTPVKESDFFDPPSTIRPSGTNFPWGTGVE